MKATLKKIGEWVTIGFGAVFGIAFAGFLAGALTIFLFRSLAPSFPWETVTPPAHNIADWRSLVVIAIGCLAILCFFLIRSLVSQPLGKLMEKSFAKWDAVAARSPSAAWMAQFILPKPSPEEIRAASVWKQRSGDFDKRIFTKAYLGSYEADEHEIIKHKKSLPSYPRLKRAGKIRAWFLGTPIVLVVAYFFLFVSSEHTEDTDDASGTDNQEGVAVETASPQSVQSSALRQWCWDVALLCSALGFPVWIVSSLSEKRYLRLLGADIRPEEGDDEIYVADPTSFESWRQAFVDHHGHDMSAEQEKKLRAAVDKVIEADEQARGAAAAALGKLSEKTGEIQEIISDGPERIGATIDASCQDPNRRDFAQALLDAALEPYFLLQLAMFANKKVNAYLTIKKWRDAGLKLPAEGTPEFFPYGD